MMYEALLSDKFPAALQIAAERGVTEGPQLADSVDYSNRSVAVYENFISTRLCGGYRTSNEQVISLATELFMNFVISGVMIFAIMAMGKRLPYPL
jgi:hypothetical protein